MKKAIIFAVSVLMLCTAMTACKKNTAEERTTPETQIQSMENPESFAELKSNFDVLTDDYNTVKKAYEDYPDANTEVETALKTAADLINHIGEPDSERFNTPELISKTNNDILDVISILDKAAAKMDTTLADVDYEQAKENYDKMVEEYNRLSVSGGENVKDALILPKSLIDEFGELSPEKFNTDDEIKLFNSSVINALHDMGTAEENNNETENETDNDNNANTDK